MRKSIFLFVVLFAVGIGIFLTRHKSDSSAEKALQTSERLIQQQIDAKIERRKHGYAKPDKPDKFLEHIYMLKTGGDPDKEYVFNSAFKELKKARLKATQLKSTQALDWKPRGPGNVGGRTRGLIIDPDDASGNTWFTGPVGGGVWKTTDGGFTWNCLTKEWPNLSVASLEMAASDNNVIYAGTGEGFGNMDAIKGNGIFKSIDRGLSWTHLPSTIDDDRFTYVSRLLIDPLDAGIVLAATNTGIYRSVDGGASWTEVYAAAEKVQDLRARPNDFNTLYASDNNTGILMSIDRGRTWSLSKSLMKGRIELATSSANPDYLYALTRSSDLYVSLDGGDNWALTSPSPKVEFLGSQGWYNNTMVVNPGDATKLFVGGIDMYSVVLGDEVDQAGTSVFDVQLTNSDFLSWSDLGGEYLAGGIKIISDNSNLFTDVEISFGNGVSQKAHRFTSSSSAALPAAADLQYADYIDVPFTAVDKSTGKQLMVSFLDKNNDQVYEPGNAEAEQFYVHAVDYSATASAEISATGGAAYQRIAVLNPRLAEGFTWNAASLPVSSILLDAYTLKSRAITSEKISVWYPRSAANYSHADHHNLAIVEGVGSPFRIVNCNDGGMFISDDGGATWEERTAGYVTSQFYGVSKHPGKNMYFGGTQDNGTWQSPEDPVENSAWVNKWGGDGFETAWHSTDPEKMAMSVYNNQIKITYNGGQSWREAAIGDVGDKAPFVTRIANEASDPELMFVGGASGVWRSTDFGLNWQLVKMPVGTWNYGSDFPHIAVSPVNSKFVWAGNAMSGANSLAFSNDGGLSFTPVSTPGGVGAYISELVAHPTNEDAAYVLFAQNGHPKILYTDDRGTSWTDLTQFQDGKSSNGFPNVAVYSLVAMPQDANVLWAGTEIGIFETTDGGLSWHYANNGLPAVCIWDMKIVGKQLVVGTHGLGIWTLDMPEIPDLLKKPVLDAGKDPQGNIAVQISLEAGYDVLELYIDDQLSKTYENIGPGVIREAIAYDSDSPFVGVQAKGKLGTQVAVSAYVDVDNFMVYEPLQGYVNSFTTHQYDFEGANFSVSEQLFNNWAIHSQHPYAVKQNNTYMLKYPIEVVPAAESAVISYRDIALIEPGSANAVYGDEEFWDYVVVEATRDGINWLPLKDGYDVNAFDKWKEFASGGISAIPKNESLFADHTINLHDSFAPGDVILLRFRLYSDEAKTGYGWVIDDLKIQETAAKSRQLKLAAGINPQGAIGVSINAMQAYDKVELYMEDELQQAFDNVTIGAITSAIQNYPVANPVHLHVKGYLGANVVVTDYAEVNTVVVNEAVQKYMNSFSSRKDDFMGDFTISDELFNNWAVHSSHPYSDNSELTYLLSYPIEVMEEGKAFMSYRDIAMLGGADNDYVILEATKDGATWVPLLDAYNVDYSSKWQAFADKDNAYANISSKPNSIGMFEEHAVNLQDFFETGDVILIRFRLHSDLNTVGWGWVIDDVIIQEAGTSVELDKQTADVLRVSPNPATSFIDLAFQSPLMGEVNVVVYDVDGRAVLARDFNKTSGLWERQLPVAQLSRGLKIVRLSINGKVYQQKVLLK
ncbi:MULTISPECIES: VPS10 domain-containing protein [unclassified Carboxylicivirga]|uniref:VPS10 domain-containing protein n=1 Tax=Carboxylicivirga TaxID=1628153 RepID=UPI003D34449F